MSKHLAQLNKNHKRKRHELLIEKHDHKFILGHPQQIYSLMRKQEGKGISKKKTQPAEKQNKGKEGGRAYFFINKCISREIPATQGLVKTIIIRICQKKLQLHEDWLRLLSSFSKLNTLKHQYYLIGFFELSSNEPPYEKHT